MRLIAVLFATIAWFATIGYRDLIHPDEGRYAELGRHILASGDWITPRLNGILYFEKPALQYWATALSFRALGVNEFAARLWPALTGALAVLALWYVARRRLGARVAVLAASVLGGCAWWIGNGHFLNLDMGLAFFLTLVLVGFWSAQHDDATPAETRAGVRVAWVAMALAVLSKGLVGIVLPGTVLVAYSAWARDWSVWRRMRWVEGLVLLFGIAGPWLLVVSLRNPAFAYFFFIHEHFGRFLTTEHHRTGPWWYFIPVLVLGMMPFTTLLPGAVRAGLAREPGRFQPNRLFVAWAAVIFVFFSVSDSKLPSYILPMFPALALLVARHVDALPARRLAAHAIAIAALCVAAIAVLALAPGLVVRGDTATRALDLEYRDWIVAGLAVVAAGAAVGASWSTRRGAVAAVAAVALASLVGVQVVMLGHQVFAHTKSARFLVESVAPKIAPDAPFYAVGTYDQSLPFYLGRDVTLVAWVDEFATGLRIEPQRAIPTIGEFERIWRQDKPGAAAMIGEKRYADLAREGLPMTKIYDDGTRVVVVRPAH